jgi:hypothetical protein
MMVVSVGFVSIVRYCMIAVSSRILHTLLRFKAVSSLLVHLMDSVIGKYTQMKSSVELGDSAHDTLLP